MPGSASLAQIEGRGLGSTSSQHRSSKGSRSSHRGQLKKGNSEPQITKSEQLETVKKAASPGTLFFKFLIDFF